MIDDWKAYLGQYDLVYQMQARCWQDGLALGNGQLAAMAYEPYHPEWVINKNDVWDYRHPEFKRHSMDYVRRFTAEGRDYRQEMAKENGPGLDLYPCPKTCGQLRIRFGLPSIYTPGHRIRKRLSLYEGTLYTALDKHLSHPRITSFVCADRNVMVVRVREVSAMTAFHNKVDLWRTPDAQMPPCTRGARGDTIWLDQPFHDGFRFVLMARVVPTGQEPALADLFRATVQKCWWHVIQPSTTVASRLEGEYAVAPVDGDFDLYLTVVTSREAPDPLAAARAALDQAVAEGADRLHAAHRQWWADFWTRSYVGLDEPLLEQLWYVSLYHLATALRGTPVAALCGLWYGPMDTPSQVLPWHGYYTNDYNAQLGMMPVFLTNHPELAEGTWGTLLAQLPAARRNARELYGLPGAYFPLSTDPTGEEITNGPYRFVQNSGPYWSLVLWWGWLYTADRAYLRGTAWPIIREVATFFVHYLTWHEDEQLYHLEISQNPELMYVKYPDPLTTLAMLKVTFQAVVEISKILNEDAELAARCRHVLDHLPGYACHGLEISAMAGLRANHHHHFQTLAALFPCGEMDPEIAPHWREHCRHELQRLDFWGSNYAVNQGRVVGWTGLAYHAGVPAGRLELADTAWRYLEDLLKANVKPSGLICHNPALLADTRRSEANIAHIPDAELYHDLDPEPLKAVEVLNGRLQESTTENLDCHDTMFPALEGPAVYLLLMGEMLLQSHNGVVRLFPALPAQRDAQFEDLRAQGPLLVSSQRVQGRVTFVRLKALADVQCRLRNPWPGSPVWRRDGQDAAEPAGRYLPIELAAGQEVVFAPTPENLDWRKRLRPRLGEPAGARSMTFSDGMMVWLGKPEPAEYYAALQAARAGQPARSGSPSTCSFPSASERFA